MTKADPESPGLRPIAEVARDLGIAPDHLEPYGRDKAKIRLEALDRAEAERPRGKLILVSAVTPTPASSSATCTCTWATSSAGSPSTATSSASRCRP